MELTLSSCVRVNPLPNFHYFGKSCFIPKPSTIRLPNHDLFSSNIAPLKAGRTTWASSSPYKITCKKPIQSVGKAKYKSSNDPDDDKYDSSTEVGAAASDDNDDAGETSYFDLGDSSLKYLSQLIGHDFETVEKIYDLMGEYGLIRLRVHVMVQWLLRLSRILEVMKVAGLSKESQTFLAKLTDQVTQKDAVEIKKIEQEMTEKDGVKAVEIFMKKECKFDPDMSKLFEFFNLSCTSEDINNLVAALMMEEAVEDIIIPAMRDVLIDIFSLADKTARIPIGSSVDSSAQKTTLGMEIAKLACRLVEAQRKISAVEIFGTYRAAASELDIGLPTSPRVELKDIAKEFVTYLGISSSPCVPQAKHGDYMDTILHSIIRFNSILSDFDREMKGHISSLDFFKPKQVKKDCDQEDNGDSAIAFEDSEYNIGIANQGLHNLTKKFPFSQREKDFSAYSPFLRSMAMCLAHSLFAYLDTGIGIEKLDVDEASSKPKNLINSLAEIILCVMGMYEVPADSESYKKLEELRENGKLGTRESIREFIEGLEIPLSTKTSLSNITLPHTRDDVVDYEALEKVGQEVEDLTDKIFDVLT